MILVLVNINMRLEARNKNLKALNLPMPNEVEIREVEEIYRIARIRRLPTLRRLQIYGDFKHSRACIDKFINGDDNDNFKFKNGQRSVFDTLKEANDDEARKSRAFVISAAGSTGNTYRFNTILDDVQRLQRTLN
jgi:hypothetical protein